MTKESESTRKRMDDWQTSISTILSRANDNLNSRPRYDNWIKKPPLYTSPVFPVGESEVAPQVIVIKQSTERPKQMVDESIATSVTRNASAQHTLNNSQLNNSINQAIHSDYQQQLANLKVEVATIRQMYDKFQKDLLFEFEARSNIITNHVKEEALIMMESNKLKMMEESKRCTDDLLNRISEFDNLKKQQSSVYEAMDHKIELLGKSQSENVTLLEGVLQSYRTKIDEIIHSMQSTSDKYDSEFQFLTSKLDQESKNSEQNRFNLKKMVSDIQVELSNQMNNIAENSVTVAQERWKQLKDDVHKATTEIASKIYNVEQGLGGDLTELQRRVEELERTSRKNSIKENTTNERISLLEQFASETKQQTQMTPSQVEKLIQAQMEKYDKRYATMKQTIEGCSQEIAKLRKRNNELESMMHAAQKKDEVRASFQANVELKIEDIERQILKANEEMRSVQQSSLRRSLTNENSINNLRDQLGYTKQDLNSLKDRSFGSPDVSRSQTPEPEPKFRAELIEQEVTKATLQRSLSALKAEVELELKKVRAEIEVYNSDMQSYREEQKDKWDQWKRRLAEVEEKQIEINHSVVTISRNTKDQSDLRQSLNSIFKEVVEVTHRVPSPSKLSTGFRYSRVSDSVPHSPSQNDEVNFGEQPQRQPRSWNRTFDTPNTPQSPGMNDSQENAYGTFLTAVPESSPSSEQAQKQTSFLEPQEHTNSIADISTPNLDSSGSDSDRDLEGNDHVDSIDVSKILEPREEPSTPPQGEVSKDVHTETSSDSENDLVSVTNENPDFSDEEDADEIEEEEIVSEEEDDEEKGQEQSKTESAEMDFMTKMKEKLVKQQKSGPSLAQFLPVTRKSVTKESSDEETSSDEDKATKLISNPVLRMQTMQASSRSILSRLKTSPFEKDEDDIDFNEIAKKTPEPNDDEYDDF